MTKRAGFLAVVLAIAIVPATLVIHRAQAAPPDVEQALAGRAGEGQAFSISGRVESVDYTANVIVVHAKGGSVTIALTPTTSVERNGESGSIADLRPGVRVTVHGTTRGGVHVAETISIRPRSGD